MDTRYKLTPPAGLHSLDTEGKVFPDFKPWSHSAVEDSIMISNLSKGYYEQPKVSMESVSARSTLQDRLAMLSHDLSKTLSFAISQRDTANKLSTTPITPTRVTLTDNKREAWLQDLSDPSKPLTKFVPNGIRNKNLLEQLCTRKVPVDKCIWFIKNVKRDKDWTEHVVHFIERGDPFFMKLLYHLYAESLIDRPFFLKWCVLFLKSSTMEQLPIALLLLKTYWDDFFEDWTKDLVELLLLKYKQVSQSRMLGDQYAINDMKLHGHIQNRLLKYLHTLINDAFARDPDSFILPNSWDTLKSVIYGVLPHTDKFREICDKSDSLKITHLNSKTPIWYLDNAQYSQIFTVADLMSWCCSKFRNNYESVYIVARLLLQDRQSELLDWLFEKPKDLDFDKLYQLLNMIDFKVTLYMRRLISSGILYLENDEYHFHLGILQQTTKQRRISKLVEEIDVETEIQHCIDNGYFRDNLLWNVKAELSLSYLKNTTHSVKQSYVNFVEKLNDYMGWFAYVGGLDMSFQDFLMVAEVIISYHKLIPVLEPEFIMKMATMYEFKPLIHCLQIEGVAIAVHSPTPVPGSYNTVFQTSLRNIVNGRRDDQDIISLHQLLAVDEKEFQHKLVIFIKRREFNDDTIRYLVQMQLLNLELINQIIPDQLMKFVQSTVSGALFMESNLALILPFDIECVKRFTDKASIKVIRKFIMSLEEDQVLSLMSSLFGETVVSLAESHVFYSYLTPFSLYLLQIFTEYLANSASEEFLVRCVDEMRNIDDALVLDVMSFANPKIVPWLETQCLTGQMTNPLEIYGKLIVLLTKGSPGPLPDLSQFTSTEPTDVSIFLKIIIVHKDEFLQAASVDKSLVQKLLDLYELFQENLSLKTLIRDILVSIKCTGLSLPLEDGNNLSKVDLSPDYFIKDGEVITIPTLLPSTQPQECCIDLPLFDATVL